MGLSAGTENEYNKQILSERLSNSGKKKEDSTPERDGEPSQKRRRDLKAKSKTSLKLSLLERKALSFIKFRECLDTVN